MKGSDSRLMIHEILKTYWGFSSFRPLQQEIIESVLAGKDTLALLPTGGGKSVCYQVPALATGGLCLVISPLIALMKDQVENLRKKKITAYAIYSGMSRKEVINVFETVTQSNCRFLYVSPERLETALFKEYLPGMSISLIAVDEAHCISQWGYDFRPAYLRIAALREELPGVPLLALTASATPEVQKDIIEKLQFHSPAVFRQSSERKNLSFSAFKTDARFNKLMEILNNVAGSSIIYCNSRKRTAEISDLLKLKGISCDYYHAGLSTEDRNRKQENWIQNKTRVIACTNAFGMGIDKANVRTVIHADMPDCLENYYQEAGRAGRDGQKAYAVLLYDQQDVEALEQVPDTRYPSLSTIRDIYQAVCNYLQIAPGMGMGEYYDFDITDFIKKFSLNSHAVLYSLKALEQEGWLAFNEQFFQPSQVCFTITKERLYQFEKEHPVFEPVLKSLLRAYEGIFDRPCFIAEFTLAQLLKTNAEEVKNLLKQVASRGVIDYSPRKDLPQLYWMRPRVPAAELYIDNTAYRHRKEKCRERVKQMISYATNETTCRSKLIGNYFGDKITSNCGICDNCLRQNKNPLTEIEFEKTHQFIRQTLDSSGITVKELVARIDFIKKEKAWEVIEFLQAENKLIVDELGNARLKT